MFAYLLGIKNACCFNWKINVHLIKVGILQTGKYGNITDSDITGRIHESRKSTAHPSDAFCVGIKISISMEYFEMEIFMPSQNASFGCAVEFRDSCIVIDVKSGT